MLHHVTHDVCLLEKWASRTTGGWIGLRAFVAPMYGWLLEQWSNARDRWQTEQTQIAWARAIEARDAYAETHGGYNASGFAIPGAVAAAARGEL